MVQLFRLFLLFFCFLSFVSCGDSVDDESKRNTNWGWIVDEDGNGSWIETGPNLPYFTANYTVFYSTGEIYETGFLREGVHEDTSIIYNKEGDAIHYIIYGDDDKRTDYYLRDGPYHETYQDGSKKAIGEIRNHKPYGYWQQFTDKGKWNQESDIKDGVGWKKDYFESGLKEDCVYVENGMQNGYLYIWYENGQISQITNWKDNVQDSTQLYYHDNGLLLRKDFWRYGEVDGPLKIYHRNGNLQHDHFYVSGKRHGSVKAYHENGKLKTEGASDNGVTIGKWYHYDESGILIQIDTYENGVVVNIENK